ncbi:MAG TPA: hypothetical protein VM842_05745 [Nitrospira sp.]|jgi:nitrous oxide reductase accessory protein NosL|nr:hypothetical protein [Nitrospira sp.]
MNHKRGRTQTAMCGRFLCGIMATLILVAGCASDKSKPMAQPSPEQVKGNADRNFDKLKQEERDRKPAGL